MNFETRTLVATRRVGNLMEKNEEFKCHVEDSLTRYYTCDWGDLDEDDKAMNDEALKSGEDMILGSYEYPDVPRYKIWIKTEWDRSVTTVLFPDEY